MARLKTLAISVASGRAGFAFFDGHQLIDWGIAAEVTKTSTALVGFIQELINQLQPDVFVSLNPETAIRKAKRTRHLIRAVAELGDQNYVLNVTTERPRPYKNGFEEAIAITKRYPELLGYKPLRRRRVFDREHRGVVLFEAVLLAEHVMFGGPEKLAGALG